MFPVGAENCSKLWNRLLPAAVPPVMLLMLSCVVTLELTGNVLSGTICAVTGKEANRQQNKRLFFTSHNGIVCSFIIRSK